MISRSGVLPGLNGCANGTGLASYPEIYPEDEWMEEMSPGARVWRVYNDEAEIIDAEIVEGFRSTADVLLVFAGLFSAVISTFVTLTSQSLQPDYGQVVAALLTELVAIQRLTATGGNVTTIPSSTLTFSSPFSPATNDLWVNGLWFGSLALSLSTALMAGLIKQWLQYYASDASGSRRSPRDRACIRQYRFIGLSKWGVRLIVELLPVLMNLALLLFFSGLIVFLRVLSGPITWGIAALTCTAYLTYLGTSIIPLFDPQCPYKTSLTWVLHSIQGIIASLLSWTKQQFQRLHHFQTGFLVVEAEDIFARWKSDTMSDAELQCVEKDSTNLQSEAVVDLAVRSSCPNVTSIALQSLAALRNLDDPSKVFPEILRQPLRQQYINCFRKDHLSERTHFQLTVPYAVAERLSRAMLCFPQHLRHDHIDRLNSLVDLSDSRDLRVIAFQMFLLNEGVYRGSRDRKLSCLFRRLIQAVLDQPPLPSSDIHPWIYHRVKELGDAFKEKDSHDDEDSGHAISYLMQNLSANIPPSIQEELLIRCLHTKWCPRCALKESSSDSPITTCFVHILANISQFLLNGKDKIALSRCYRLLLDLLAKFEFQERQNNIKIWIWSMKPVIISFSDTSDGSYQSLIRLLHSLTPKDGLPSSLWTESPSRLDVVLHLYTMLYSLYGNEVICRSILKTISSFAPPDEPSFQQAWDQYNKLHSFVLDKLVRIPARWKMSRWKAAVVSYLEVLKDKRNKFPTHYGQEVIASKLDEIVQVLQKEHSSCL